MINFHFKGFSTPIVFILLMHSNGTGSGSGSVVTGLHKSRWSILLEYKKIGSLFASRVGSFGGAFDAHKKCENKFWSS
jgi:hypothetical protein